MLEMGQPMHAFDCEYLEGNAICVRRANEEEKIVTLDEQEYTLNPNNLVICDGVKPVALAGVMGGLNSEIRQTTASVMFESAKFARDNVRRHLVRLVREPIQVRSLKRVLMNSLL
jgi:phenylalanyl-tRNA synthetase beta chain